jgi:hypothetical protein
MRLDQLMRFAGVFFEEEGVDYFIFGATAMNFWVPPRNTVDLDVVLCVDKRRGREVLGKLRGRKFPITKSSMRKFLDGRLIKLPIGDAELDLKLCKTEHERQALARSKVFSAGDHRLRIAVPEDLVLFKLQYWRRQDQADIEKMLSLRADLDVKYIEKWLDPIEEQTGFPVRDRWKEIHEGS